MKQICLLIALSCISPLLQGQAGPYRHGTVVRMHMGDCILAHHGFMLAFGGPTMPPDQEPCPEYTLVSDNVVFVIVGKMSKQLIPLAETIAFHLSNNELAVRVDDANHEVKFTIKEMMLRSDWERVQRHIEEKMRSADARDPER